MRLDDGDLLIGVIHHRPHRAIHDYAQRWGIETLFGCLKSREFCLESTHLKDPERLSRMIALLTLALCWAFRTEEWLAQQQVIPIKKHGRKAKSLFRHGLDHLRRILLGRVLKLAGRLDVSRAERGKHQVLKQILNLEQFMDEFLQVLHFLSCT